MASNDNLTSYAGSWCSSDDEKASSLAMSSLMRFVLEPALVEESATSTTVDGTETLTRDDIVWPWRSSDDIRSTTSQGTLVLPSES